MDFFLKSLRPWNGTPQSRQPGSSNFGLPLERSYSSASQFGGCSSFERTSTPELDVIGITPSAPLSLQRFSSIDGLFRLPSMECLRRASSIEGMRRMSSLQEMDSSDSMDSISPLQPQPLGFSVSSKQASPQLDENETADSVFQQDDDDSSGNEHTSISTPSLHEPSSDRRKTRRRARADSTMSKDEPTGGAFQFLDETRPWEQESVEALNTIPPGFSPDADDFSLSLGDLRVLARFHVQRKANLVGIKLPAGMTNADLVKLASDLGLFPLVFRLHLEATGRIEVPELHRMYLEYKRESKVRAKINKAHRDMGLASKTRLKDDGSLTIDYFEGIELRLGRERDTIFRPLLHRVFREFKGEVKAKLAQAGLNHNEMRKWRDTQLCTALWVANMFVDGIWQSAVDVHLTKTRDFV